MAVAGVRRARRPGQRDVDSGLAGGAVDLAWALYLDMARLTTRGLTRSRLAGIRLARTRRPIALGQVDDGAGGHARSQDDLVAGCVQGDGDAGAVGAVAAASAMAVRRTW
jgi:hypothetical protein